MSLYLPKVTTPGNEVVVETAKKSEPEERAVKREEVGGTGGEEGRDEEREN